MPFRSFKPRNRENWEELSSAPVPQKQYTYVAGFGFIPYDAKKEEEKYIKRRSNYLAISAMIFLIIEASLSVFRPLVADYLKFSTTNIYGLVYTISSLFIGLLLSGIIYCILIEMPIEKAMPKGTLDIGMVFSGIGIFLLTSTIGEVASSIIFFVLNTFEIRTNKITPQIPDTAFESMLFLVLLYIVPVIIEEFFFQGIVLQSLRPIGDGFAIITTALITTFFIGDYSNFISIFLTSLILCYFCIRTNNTFVPIFIKVFGSLIWGWQEQVMALVGESNGIIKPIILILFVILGGIAVLYIVFGREDMLKLEDIETTIIYRGNIGKFFTTFSFVVMSFLMIIRMIWLK